MRINNNIMAMNTHRQLGLVNTMGARSMEKLSSGFRINRAGDDAAGLAISEKMRAQIRGLNQASRNAQDAISLIQTAEGALNETHSILQRMRELAVQSSSDTNVDVDRTAIQDEMNQLTSEINRIANTTEFNTMKLVNGDRENVTAQSSVTTTTVGLVSGIVTVTDISDYTIATDDSLSAGGNFSDYLTNSQITVAAGDFVSSASTNSGTIEILRTTSGFTVNLSTTAVTSFSAVDTLSADANGDFVYNDHGISFTITAANAANISAGASIQVTGYSGNATIAFNDDYGANTSTAATITSGITVTDSDSDVDNANVRDIVILQNGGTLTVTLRDSAAGDIHVDQFVNISTAATVDFDAHGISFTYTIGFASAGASVSAVISLDSLVSSTSTTETNTVITTDNSLKFQVGANEDQSMSLELADMTASALYASATAGGTTTLTIDGSSVTAYYVSTENVTDGTSSTNTEFSLDVSSHEKAGAAVTVINAAIESVSSERSKLGSVQNRLEHTTKNLDTSSENLQAAESRIRDVDMAKEMMEFTRNNILQQAAQAMLAQANQAPQGVLQLLR